MFKRIVELIRKRRKIVTCIILLITIAQIITAFSVAYWLLTKDVEKQKSDQHSVVLGKSFLSNGFSESLARLKEQKNFVSTTTTTTIPKPPPWRPKPCDEGWFPLKQSVCFITFRAVNADVYLVRIDLHDPEINVRPQLIGKNGGPGMLKRAAQESGALVAVNGTFFKGSTGLPLGPAASNGQWVNWDGFPQWVLMWYKDDPNNAHIVPSEIAVQLKVEDIEFMVSGTPALVRDGKRVEDFGPDNKQGILYGKHPRTAVGVDGKGRMLLLVVDEVKGQSRGATVPDLSGIMAFFGAKNAVNLDGGGSTELVIGGQIANHPSENKEMPSALMIVCC